MLQVARTSITNNNLSESNNIYQPITYSKVISKKLRSEQHYISLSVKQFIHKSLYFLPSILIEDICQNILNRYAQRMPT